MGASTWLPQLVRSWPTNLIMFITGCSWRTPRGILWSFRLSCKFALLRWMWIGYVDFEWRLQWLSHSVIIVVARRSVLVEIVKTKYWSHFQKPPNLFSFLTVFVNLRIRWSLMISRQVLAKFVRRKASVGMVSYCFFGYLRWSDSTTQCGYWKHAIIGGSMADCCVVVAVCTSWLEAIWQKSELAKDRWTDSQRNN